jgi:hypothetical protein
MLDVDAWIRTKLEGDAALVALLGSTDQIMYEYPNTFAVVPIVTYQEFNQPHGTFGDDAPTNAESYVGIDIWNNDNGTTAIAEAIDTIMVGLFYACEYNAPVPEPDTKFRHRVMRYRRQLTAEDLV